MTYPLPVVSSLLEAIGQADTMVSGHLETFLAEPLSWDDSEIVVAATERWPDPATIQIEREVIEVTTKDATTFSITSRPNVLPSTALYNTGTLVVDISRNYSEIDIIRRQMLVNYATGDYLVEIGRNYGVPRPAYKGLPLYFTDDTYRAYLKIIIALEAGPQWGIMRVLNAMFSPITATATTDSSYPQRVTFAAATIPEGMKRGLIRLEEDWSQVHRVVEIDPDGLYLELDANGGPNWVGADFETVSDPPGVDVELFPWDIWEQDDRPGEFFIELYERNDTGYPWGATYLQGGEKTISSTADTVVTRHDINQVFGVWLATDTTRSGTNYYTGGSFTGKVITLGTSLSGPGVDVIIDYGNVDPSTAQLLQDVDVENYPAGTYWPFYISDYAALLRTSGVLDIIRALGMRPVVSSHIWGAFITPEPEEDMVLATGISFTRPSADVVRLTPIGVGGKAYVWVEDASGNTVKITVDSALDCDLSTTGAGGLQTGDTYSVSTGYQIVLIAKGDLPEGYWEPALIAMENGATITPTLPGGYTHWSTVLSFGAATTGPDLFDFVQVGGDYRYQATLGVQVESAYKGTSPSHTDCSKTVPYYAHEMLIEVSAANNDSGVGIKTAELDDKNGNLKWVLAMSGDVTDAPGSKADATVPVPHIRGTAPEVEAYWDTAVTSGGLTLLVQGFTIFLG